MYSVLTRKLFRPFLTLWRLSGNQGLASFCDTEFPKGEHYCFTSELAYCLIGKPTKRWDIFLHKKDPLKMLEMNKMASML